MKKALLAAAATGVQVGAATVASRAVIQSMGPTSLAFLRYALAVLILLPFVIALQRRQGKIRFAGRDGPVIVVLGVLQFGLLISLLNFGLRSVNAALGTLLFTTFPFIAMLLAAALGLERMTAARTAGVLLTIAGVGLALYERMQVSVDQTAWVGMAAILAAACCGAVCSVLYRPYLRRYPTLVVGFAAMLASVLSLALPAWMEGLPAMLATLPLRVWAAVAFIGLSSGIGYVLWLYALKHSTPTRVTVFMGLSPLTAAFLGTLMLGEPFSAYQSVGALAVLMGLWMATRVRAAQQ